MAAFDTDTIIVDLNVDARPENSSLLYIHDQNQ